MIEREHDEPAPDGRITPELWRSKPVVTEHVLFTGFDPTGNGFDVLDWLHSLNVTAVVDADSIHIVTPEREDAVARPGDWIIRGTRGEVYPVRPAVHADKYEPVEPA